MITRLSYEEDLALKRFAQLPADQRPIFHWRSAVEHEQVLEPLRTVRVRQGEETVDFDLGWVAETVGNALTSLGLSRREEEIFTESNREFVSLVARTVAERLAGRARAGGGLILSRHDVDLLIEKTLIDLQAHDVARSLVFQRAPSQAREEIPLAVRVIRRNNQEVPWDRNKVEVATRKAFLAVQKDSEAALVVAQAVTERVRNLGASRIHIEEVQDLVQEELMRLGHYKVAEAYILYRAHRARLRELAARESAGEDSRQSSMIVIRGPEGQTFFWDGLDLKRRIDFAGIGLRLDLARAELETCLRRGLHPEMSSADLRQTILRNSRALLERDADYVLFAARLLLTYLYEETLGWDIVKDGLGQLKEYHRLKFRRALETGVRIGRLHPDLLAFDLDRLAEALDPGADLDFDHTGLQTLYDRFLLVDPSGPRPRRLEAPQFFWMRVAMGLCRGEAGDREAWAIRVYNLVKSRRFCPSSAILRHAGAPRGQLCSSYLFKVEDSLESIMQRGIAENAYLSRAGAGLGGSWTALRGAGSPIRGTGGESRGLIPFLRLHNDQLAAVSADDRRRAVGCAYLETWHSDLLEFLELRRPSGDERRRTHDLHTALWVPDLFLKRVEAQRDWTLFHAHETPDLPGLAGRAFQRRYEEYERMAAQGRIHGRLVPAADLWKRILQMLGETGYPWIAFKDACLLRHPQDHVGTIHGSGPETALTLNTGPEETAGGILGALNLETHLTAEGALDQSLLRETIRLAVRVLDDALDLNYHATSAVENALLRHRPIGLGVMGLQHALYRRNCSFASAEAVEFSDEFMEAVAFHTLEASSDLAAERGTYPSYEGSQWHRGLLPQDSLDRLAQERELPVEVPRGGRLDWQPLREKIQRQGLRHAHLLALAPNASTARLVGTSPGVEPAEKNLLPSAGAPGENVALHPFLVRDLQAAGLWRPELLEQLKYFDGELDHFSELPRELRRKYLTAFGIEARFLLEAAARRQKWVDQSQILHLWVAAPDLVTLSELYRTAWRLGLKTTCRLRTLGASNLEKAAAALHPEIR